VIVAGTGRTASGVAVDLVADTLVVGSEAAFLESNSPTPEVAATAGGGDETTSAGDLVVVATGAGLGFSTTVLET
jgi:hypothetical protein